VIKYFGDIWLRQTVYVESWFSIFRRRYVFRSDIPVRNITTCLPPPVNAATALMPLRHGLSNRCLTHAYNRRESWIDNSAQFYVPVDGTGAPTRFGGNGGGDGQQRAPICAWNCVLSPGMQHRLYPAGTGRPLIGMTKLIHCKIHLLVWVIMGKNERLNYEVSL